MYVNMSIIHKLSPIITLSLNACIKYATGMLDAIVLYVRLSVCFHHNSITIRRRMMKLGTYILEVKSSMEFEDGSRA